MPSRRSVIAGAVALAATPALASIPTFLRSPTHEEKIAIFSEAIVDHVGRAPAAWRARAAEREIIRIATDRGLALSPRVFFEDRYSDVQVLRVYDSGLSHYFYSFYSGTPSDLGLLTSE
jgi:hypothetical protein